MRLHGIDYETRSELSVKDVGTYRYMTHPSTQILTVAVKFDGCDTISIPHPTWGGDPEEWEELKARISVAIESGDKFVAANSGFDRAAHRLLHGGDEIDPDVHREAFVCVLNLARRCCFPGRLESLASVLGVPIQKNTRGKFLIKALSVATNPLPDNWPELIDEMCVYGRDDVDCMMLCWPKLLPYSLDQWKAFWASEKINDTGLPIDVDLCHAASSIASRGTEEINRRLQEITDVHPTYNSRGTRVTSGMTLGNHGAKAAWLSSQLEPWPDLQTLLVKEWAPDGTPAKLSLDEHARGKINEALADDQFVDEMPGPIYERVCDFMEALEEGSGAAHHKFIAMAERTSPDQRLRGAYMFDGAGATGRLSSKGAQMHNLINKTVPDLEGCIEILKAQGLTDPQKQSGLKEITGFGLSTTLGRLVRPAITAPEGRVLVWSDYSGIEARGLAWAADNEGGRDRLKKIERGFDFYCDIASKIFSKTITKADNPFERSVGKGVELGSGYGGGVGAFKQTAKKFGLQGIPDATVKEWVGIWREDNPWCVRFWYQVKDAVDAAHTNPGTLHRAGRLAYQFVPGLFGGTLLCQLPSGRHLVYPYFRTSFEDRAWDDGSTTRVKVYSCKRWRKGVMRTIHLWHGTFVENAVQALCNDLLRLAMVEATSCEWEGRTVVIGTTHDELIAETDFDARESVGEQLSGIMSTAPDWADGFPIDCSLEIARRYEKRD